MAIWTILASTYALMLLFVWSLCAAASRADDLAEQQLRDLTEGLGGMGSAFNHASGDK